MMETTINSNVGTYSKKHTTVKIRCICDFNTVLNLPPFDKRKNFCNIPRECGQGIDWTRLLR